MVINLKDLKILNVGYANRIKPITPPNEIISNISECEGINNQERVIKGVQINILPTNGFSIISLILCV